MKAASDVRSPTIINGMNVEDLEGLIAGVAADRARGLTQWCVNSTWQGRAQSRAQVDGCSIGGQFQRRAFSIDIDEPTELGGEDLYANPQEFLFAALNACMIVGYVAQCTIRRIKLTSLKIETRGDIDLRGLFGLDPAVRPGYEHIDYTVRIKGDATAEQFAEIHQAVMATSPNFYNVSQPVAMRPNLVIE